MVRIREWRINENRNDDYYVQVVTTLTGRAQRFRPSPPPPIFFKNFEQILKHRLGSKRHPRLGKVASDKNIFQLRPCRRKPTVPPLAPRDERRSVGHWCAVFAVDDDAPRLRDLWAPKRRKKSPKRPPRTDEPNDTDAFLSALRYRTTKSVFPSILRLFIILLLYILSAVGLYI